MSIKVQIRRKLDSFLLDISFQSESRRIGILGASGCGKSMTLKSIAGIETPDQGCIEVEGHTLFDREHKINLKPQRRNVGYLFQNYALFPTMTVEKNIAAGLKGSRQGNEARVREMVAKFQLQGLEKRLPGQLSGGQQQRVALARIMAYEPDMILLDEPFSALDMYLKDRLQQELMDMLADYRGTVIMVSHNRDELYRFSEELLIIDQGHIVAAGETKELFRNPVSREAARLTGCKNFSRALRTGELLCTQKEKYRRMYSGSDTARTTLSLCGENAGKTCCGLIWKAARSFLLRETIISFLRTVRIILRKRRIYAGSCREKRSKSWKREGCRIICCSGRIRSYS